jgi:integrase
MGSIYKRKWKDKTTGKWVEGETYWIKYYRHGKPYRESSGSNQITKAQRLLKKREGEIVEGKLPGIHFEKVTFDDLANGFLTDYRINKKDTLNKAERSVKYLKEYFWKFNATEVTTDRVKSYINERMEKGFSNASINRELAALKRIFRLGAQCAPPKVSMIPYVPMLKESNVRKGFFEYQEYLSVKEALPEDLPPIITFAYHSGWRKSEILALTWYRVDLREGIARLDPGETKNEEGRILYFNEELMKEMKTLHSNRRLGCPDVFHREVKQDAEGNLIVEQIQSFRKAWATACIKAGLCEVLKDEEGNPVVVKGKKSGGEVVKIPNRIFYDFRRTAIRDMVRSGVSERVAMVISGHKSRSVFERYNIVNDQDLREAARKKQTYHEKQNVMAGDLGPKHGEVISFRQAQNG